MNPASICSRRAAWLALWLAAGSVFGFAAPSISQQIDPPEINLGDSANVTITVQNGNIPEIHLPNVEGLEIAGQSTQSGITIVNGSMTSSMSVTFAIQPTRAGNFTIPAFDVTTQDGIKLHVQEMKLHVLGSGTAPASPTVNPTPSASGNNSAPGNNTPTPFNPNGPVVMPPNNPAPAGPGGPDNGTANTTGSSFTPPTDPDGRPAKVFLVVTPNTTDAYVGETIPMRIDFYIRMDAYYQQDSLPTIDGSDFLMNDLSVHPEQEGVAVMNEDYQRFSWITAIEAPKSGDFPLQIEQDTYWIKSIQRNFITNNPLANFFMQRPVLGHENIPSNRLVIHVHSLPEQGRPANFTGAIGQFKASADATPDSVDIGDPVTLHFTVTGQGNFSYVQSPALAADPNWKAYVPSSKAEFADQARTMGTKTFTQSIIPKKNGMLPLPPASFSYFDPETKQYVTVPVSLPSINVTGSAPVIAAAAPGSDSESNNAAPVAAAAPSSAGFLPNRLEVGALQASLVPVYRKPWFWAVQGALAVLVLSGVLISFFGVRAEGNGNRAEDARRRQSLRLEEDAMSEAVRKGDNLAFFLAARHAVQLRLGAQWRLQPEAITLAEIRERDPQMAAAFEPLFQQADEIIYSGGSDSSLDLAQWETRVREDLSQMQPA
ncbi:MAG TPA: BatD family protein [Candidatus Methylacidiphilales bacterium]|nr:BatD family protein [Candidatus Methylacidiphilales bacterium]